MADDAICAVYGIYCLRLLLLQSQMPFGELSLHPICISGEVKGVFHQLMSLEALAWRYAARLFRQARANEGH